MDSPFASRLDSNYVATDSESLEIQNLLVLPTSRLKELSTQLQLLDEQSTKIRNEQSAILLFISKHRGLISQIRKLPIDILQEIFIACLPTDYNPDMSRRQPPILLTQICSSWRNVAHATPQLWKSIVIDVPCNSPSMTMEHIERFSEAIQEWLTKSADFPLHIVFDSDNWGASGANAVRFCDKIIDSLIRFSERWRVIRLSIPYQALKPITSLPPSNFPILEIFSVNCFYSFYPTQSVCITSGVLNAPNLRELRVSGLQLTHDHLGNVSRLPINWSQLTNIVLDKSFWDASSCLSISMAYKLLSLCRNLVTCQMDIGGRIGPNEELPLETNTFISLPFLTRLSVGEYTSLSRLFSLLHLPSLNDIEFYTTLQPTTTQQSSLLSLLTRFRNTIRLIINPRYFTRLDFIECLRLCPLLKSLDVREKIEEGDDIHSCKIDDAFLKLFFESSNDEGAFCPHLEVFSCLRATAFSETTLLQFVREKNGGSSTTGLAKLKRLSVAFDCLSLRDFNQELEPFIQAGLVTSIFNGF